MYFDTYTIAQNLICTNLNNFEEALNLFVHIVENMKVDLFDFNKSILYHSKNLF